MTGTQKSCECPLCQELCHAPCMGTPKEILAIIKHGYAYPDWLTVCTDNDPKLDFIVVKPALKNDACTYYKNGKCILHIPGLKPSEGRIAIHNQLTPRAFYRRLARSWNTKLGRELIERIQMEAETQPLVAEAVEAMNSQDADA